MVLDMYVYTCICCGLQHVMFIGSYDGHGMRLAEAVQDCSDGHPVILLAHQPKAAKTALDSPLSTNIELVLSGRSHT